MKNKRFTAIRRPIVERRVGIVSGYIHGFEVIDGTYYLILGSEDVLKKIATNTDQYHGCPYKDIRGSVIEIDNIPHAVFSVNEKYAKMLLRQETTHAAYSALKQFFTDDDLKIVFYDLWIKEHNFLASETNRKEYNRCHGHFNRPSKDQGHIHHITTAMSGKEAAIASIH